MPVRQRKKIQKLLPEVQLIKIGKPAEGEQEVGGVIC